MTRPAPVAAEDRPARPAPDKRAVGAESARRARVGPIRVANFVLPGAGLIVAGREWLGLSIAMFYGVCAHVALAGWFVAPLAWPRWLTWLATLFVFASWTAAQFLLCQRLRSES